MFVRLEFALLQRPPQRLVIEALACPPRNVSAKHGRERSCTPQYQRCDLGVGAEPVNDFETPAIAIY